MAKHIPEDTAKEIRERYQWLHELNDDAPQQDRLTSRQIDQKVAEEFGISVSSLGDLVCGITHGDAGGPIDHKRRTRRDLFQRETVTLGVTEARRRFNLRCRNIDPAPKVEKLVHRVTVMDSKGNPTAATADLAPGEWIKIELIAVGGDR